MVIQAQLDSVCARRELDSCLSYRVAKRDISSCLWEMVVEFYETWFESEKHGRYNKAIIKSSLSSNS